ncbi:MAG TPA: serine/threonine-protein kinase [Pyrinomonadaceae bacterium]
MDKQNIILKERYQLDRLLGRGGMGEVFLAEDKLLSRYVAVKKVVYSGNEYLLKTAQAEAMVLARLRHESLPKILDYFNEDQAQYIVMEYIDGQDLGEMLQFNDGPFTPTRVWPWVDTLLDILEYLHNQSPPVVHRDIKPTNIKITDAGKLFLIDFGLVKDTPTRVMGGSFSQSVYGYSHSYAPLEQINGDPTSVQTDVYGLCATLYHLLTNVKPADALDRAANKIERKPDPLRPAHKVNANVPPGLSLALEQGLHLNSEDRIKSTQELRRLLLQERNKTSRIEVNIRNDADGYISQIAPAPPPPPTPRFADKKRVAAFAAAAIMLLSATSIGGYKLYELQQEKQEARRLFAVAQGIESTEGLLSSNACAKYEEVVGDRLDQKMRNQLALKTNSCTSVKRIFQEVADKEQANGLNYETATAYRKIIEDHSGTVFARQAEKKVGEYERNEQATLRAYKALQKADYDTTLPNMEQMAPDTFKQLAGGFFQATNLYGQIDLTNVDPLLSGHIINSMEAFKRWKTLFSEIDAERDTIINNMEANISSSGEIFRDYYLKMAATEFANVLTTKYASRFQTFIEEAKKLDEMDKTYGSQLQTKFNNRGFIDLN